ncbi:MAG TPA: succinate dehydrogenase assembly factor 2 [Caulobacteraceae bacterium]
MILGPFADARAGGMSATDLSSFERLLEVNDQDLYGWILGTTPTPVEFDDGVMAALRQSAWSGQTPRGG